MMGNTAIVLAAGSGKRMNSAVAKQYLMLKDKPVIWYALKTFEESIAVDNVVLVVGTGEVEYCRKHIIEEYGFAKVRAVIEGGGERYLSVWEGLKWIAEHSDKDGQGVVFIHDGARPFVNEQIIQDTYSAAKEYGACVAAMPAKDTIKIGDEEGFAVQTPNRKTVWMVQTPQVFDNSLITEAYRTLVEQLDDLKKKGIEITDDAMVVETMMGRKVKLVPASYENIKITTPEDMKIAECLLVE